jgi:D-glycerate 3-kinase
MQPQPPLLTSILPHLLPPLEIHLSTPPLNGTRKKSFVIAISGPQGSGKTTLTSHLTTYLTQAFKVKVLSISIDDFYLPHTELTERGKQNRLWKHRGLPGTHDFQLAREFFETLLSDHCSPKSLKLPQYDKSAYSGAGDRIAESQWITIDPEAISVVILEGWCVAFQPIAFSSLQRHKTLSAQFKLSSSSNPPSFLADYELSDLEKVNSALSDYNTAFMNPEKINLLITIDLEESFTLLSNYMLSDGKNELLLLQWMVPFVNTVTAWRTQQEHALHASHSRGMTDDAVKAFVRGYMPAYQLYLPRLRLDGYFSAPSSDSSDGEPKSKRQIKVLIDKERSVVDIHAI